MGFKPRLFLASITPSTQELVLESALSTYLVRVLKLKEGNPCTGFDAEGREYDLALRHADPEHASVSVVGVHENSSAGSKVSIVLAQSLPKGSKMDLILRQGTEIGVDRFIPFISQRSISRPEESHWGHKQDRWKKILVEATRQCGRRQIPMLDSIMDWEKTLSSLRDFDLVLVPYEKQAPMLKEALESKEGFKTVLTLIGPEGGWGLGELRDMELQGAVPVHLPTPIMRTETAGLAVISMVQFYLNRNYL